MAYSKLFVIFACTVLAASAARVPRDAPEEPIFTNMIKTTQENLKIFESDFLKFFGTENRDELEHKAKDEVAKIASKFDTMGQNLKEVTDKLADSPAVVELRTSLENIFKDMRITNDGTVDELKSYVGKVSQNTQEIMNKIKDLGESDEAHKIQDLSKSLMENVETSVKKITDQIQETIKQ